MKRWTIAALAAGIGLLQITTNGIECASAQSGPAAAHTAAYAVGRVRTRASNSLRLAGYRSLTGAPRLEPTVDLSNLLFRPDATARADLQEQEAALRALRASPSDPEYDSDGDGMPDVIDKWPRDTTRW